MDQDQPKHIVCGILERDGRILMTQRLSHKELPYQWEFPSGKVEPGETHYEAIVRELREGIGIDVQSAASVYVARNLRAGGLLYEAMFWRVTAYSGEPKPIEGQGIGWFSELEVLRVDITPGTAAFAVEARFAKD